MAGTRTVLGDIKTAIEINRPGSNKYQLCSCADCGKESRVTLLEAENALLKLQLAKGGAPLAELGLQ